MATNWKARAQEAEAALNKAVSYIYDYGNASHRCAAGYYQQRGLICHHCRHDNSRGSPCPVATKEQKE